MNNAEIVNLSPQYNGTSIPTHKTLESLYRAPIGIYTREFKVRRVKRVPNEGDVSNRGVYNVNLLISGDVEFTSEEDFYKRMRPFFATSREVGSMQEAIQDKGDNSKSSADKQMPDGVYYFSPKIHIPKNKNSKPYYWLDGMAEVKKKILRGTDSLETKIRIIPRLTSFTHWVGLEKQLLSDFFMGENSIGFEDLPNQIDMEIDEDGALTIAQSSELEELIDIPQNKIPLSRKVRVLLNQTRGIPKLEVSSYPDYKTQFSNELLAQRFIKPDPAGGFRLETPSSEGKRVDSQEGSYYVIEGEKWISFTQIRKNYSLTREEIREILKRLPPRVYTNRSQTFNVYPLPDFKKKVQDRKGYEGKRKTRITNGEDNEANLGKDPNRAAEDYFE